MKTQNKVTKLDFTGQTIYVGIDVHLKSWSVEVLSERSVLKKFRQNPEPEALHKFLATNYPNATYYSVYEAGFCGFWIHHRLMELGIENIVVNPADVPTMSWEKLRKTDAVDCSKLARGLRSGDLRGIYVPSAQMLEIRSLIRLRNSIVKDTTREKNRIKSLLHFLGIEIPEEFARPNSNWSKRFLAWLKGVEFITEYGRKRLDVHLSKYTHLRSLLLQETREIRQLTRSVEFEESMRLITSIPGIGVITGITFLCELDDIHRFRNSDHLASFVGLIPMCHSSGEKDGTGEITIRKHAALRSNIVEAAWVAIRKDPAMTLCFGEYCKRMDATEAIVKIARKLIRRIFYVLKHKQMYVCSVVE